MHTIGLDRSGAGPGIETVGRIALGTQGFLYLVVGVLAERIAQGRGDEEASQTGAIQAVARQPFGKFLLIVLIAGLVTHVLWRLTLAVRGEPGDDEDGGSVAKRAANVGRAAIYAGFTVAAVRVLLHAGSTAGGGQGGSGGGKQQRTSTAEVLTWPGGRWIVVAAGLVVVGVGVYNLGKGVTRKFLEHLDLHERSEAQQRAIEVIGLVGYAARGVVFGLVGWFLVQAGLAHDANRTKGLDEALRKVAEGDHGTLLLGILAVGVVLFGAFRILDGLFRRPSDIAYA